MDFNDIVVIVLLLCAVIDTAGAKYWLPRFLDKEPMLVKKDKKRLIQLVNLGSIVFFSAAIVIYLLKPF